MPPGSRRPCRRTRIAPVILLAAELLTGVARGQLYVLAQTNGTSLATTQWIRPGTLSAMALLGSAAMLVMLPWTFGPMYHLAVIPFLAKGCTQ